MIFKEEQQRTHREIFIEECRQKAWGCACHADWIAKGLDQVMDEYTKLSKKDSELEAESKALEGALDSHTKDNRDKRKEIQSARDRIAHTLKSLGANVQTGQQALQQLIQSADNNLQLAEYAETWSWKEAEPKPEEKRNAQICEIQNCKGPKGHEVHADDLFKYDDFEEVSRGA